MKIMLKKIYTAPKITETRLDADINILLASCGTPSQTGGDCSGFSGMILGGSNETDGEGISQFMNPLKWFR